MEIKIDFDNSVIPENKVLEIGTVDLDDFYADASDFDKGSLFFMLLTSVHHYEENGDKVRAAHLSFLAAYYLFTVFTPLGSLYLSLHYIKKAISLNHLPKYDEWLALMEQGN